MGCCLGVCDSYIEYQDAIRLSVTILSTDDTSLFYAKI